MKAFSTRFRIRLRRLQSDLQKAANDRDSVVQHLLASRAVLTAEAQRELWMEFVWLQQEYRMAVCRLAEFCEQQIL